MTDHEEPRRFQDPDDLVCPECFEGVRPEPPTSWLSAWGPRPEFSHFDGEPLCPVVGPAGYVPALPVVKSGAL